jgi:hypothetical protein
MYRRTNGPLLSSMYLEPTGKRMGRHAELRIAQPPLIPPHRLTRFSVLNL